MVICVIPAFRAVGSIAEVVEGARAVCDLVIVVDDACPEGTGATVSARFAHDARVELIRHDINRGVGGAMKTGMMRALARGATTIVKLDADGQMDPAYIPAMIEILEREPKIAFVKGNRFFDDSVTRVMPGIRLIGNSALTLLVRFTSGYWNSIDPTNGYFALRASVARRLRFDRLAERYYFEISLLVELAMRRAELAEVEIPAHYGDERSGLSISRTLLTFPFLLVGSFVRRILWRYIIADMNAGSLFLIFGALLGGAGALLGGIWWAQALESGLPRTPGTVTIVLSLLIIGFQLLLNALLFDVQFAPRVLKIDSEELAVAERSSANVSLVR